MLTKKLIKTCVIILAYYSINTNVFAASNFTIYPKAGTELPISILQGQTLSAVYTVTNMTRTSRNGYTVQGLPNTVKQITSDPNYIDLCTSPINLAGKASCTLLLQISGEAKSSFVICNGMNCTTAAVPLNVALNPTSLPIIATGKFFDTSFVLRPLLGQSQDNGQTWTYPEAIYFSGLPDPVNGGHLYSAYCSGQRCLGAGCYPGSLGDAPLLALTHNGGSTWTYPNQIYTALPNDFQSGNLDDVSISGNLLVSTGYYSSINPSVPLIAVSQDGGTTWTYPTDAYNPLNLPPSFVSGVLNGVSCIANRCASSGFFSDGAAHLPLIAISQNAGSNWTYPAGVYTSALPIGYLDGTLDYMSCTDSICAANGFFDDAITRRPLLAMSQNQGVTWTFPPDVYSTALPADFNSGDLRDVNCSGIHCVAVGHFEGANDQLPLAAVTLDNGISWNYPPALYSTALPTPFGSGHFNSVSCSGNLCIAVGAYEEVGTGIGAPIPLLAITYDAGVTWSYPAAIRGSILPDPFIAGEFISASCSGSRCIAAGIYNDGVRDLPLLIITNDGGTTWRYPPEIHSTALPAIFESGLFDGGTSVSQLSMAAQYFNKYKRFNKNHPR